MQQKEESMKTKSFLLLAVLIVSLGGCRFWGVRGSGDIETEERNVEEFNSIEASGAFEIRVTMGEEQNVSVTADDNLLRYIVTKVRNGKLILETKREINPRRDIVVTITALNLKQFEASGACDIFVENISNDYFEVDMSGASDIKLQGSTDKFLVDISGAGNVNAKNLIAKNVRVSLSGASDAIVHATESLDAEVSGVGSVDYYGDPDKVVTDVSGVGSINRK